MHFQAHFIANHNMPTTEADPSPGKMEVKIHTKPSEKFSIPFYVDVHMALRIESKLLYLSLNIY